MGLKALDHIDHHQHICGFNERHRTCVRQYINTSDRALKKSDPALVGTPIGTIDGVDRGLQGCIWSPITLPNLGYSQLHTCRGIFTHTGNLLQLHETSVPRRSPHKCDQ